MNRTVTLPEIAAQTALAAGTDNDNATRFLVSLFATVKSALAADGTAVVKGLGTFRRDADAPDGVRFTPEKALADAVNAPFSAFAPLPLPADAPADIFDEDEPAPEEKEEPTEPAAQPPVEPEPEQESMEDADDTPGPGPQPEEDAETEEESLPRSETETEPEVIYVTRRSVWPWIVAAAMLAVGFAAGFHFGTRNSAVADVGPMPDTIMAAAQTPDTVAAAAPADTFATTTAGTDTIAAAPAQQQKEPVYDTVSATRFLTTIARDHYGRKDFWVFIYEANADKLRHPNRIRPGTRVLVPDLGDHAALDAATRKRAHELATEIYNRYDMN